MTNNSKNIKVLVSGASGFVGLHLLEALVADGNKVIALHHRPLQQPYPYCDSDMVTWVKFDITADSVEQYCENVDVVFHLAGYSTIEETEDELKKLKLVNVHGTEKFASGCKSAGVKQFIFVSSIAACEFSDVQQIDETNGYPQSAYGKSKLEAESLLLTMAENDFNITILRPTALFGEDHLGSVYELVKAIKHKRFVLFGSGEYRTNFYYIKDFVEVLIRVQGNQDAYGQVFIASDDALTIKDISSIILEALQMQFKIPSIPYLLGCSIAYVLDQITYLVGIKFPLSKRRFRAMTKDNIFVHSKLSSLLEVKPIYGIKSGLRRTVSWYRTAGLL